MAATSQSPPPTAPVRARRGLVTALFVIAVVTGLLAVLTLWLNRQALNTDNWSNTSSQLLADPKVQDAVGAYLVDQVFQNVDVAGELQQALPPRAAPLAGPAAAGLREFADRTAPELLARPRVQAAWRQANRVAHRQLLRVLNGGGAGVSTQNGRVVLNLHTLVDQLATSLGVQAQVAKARAKVQGAGSNAAVRGALQQRLGVTLPQSSGQIVILRSSQLKTAQNAAKAIRGLAFVFTALTLILFALAVWLARGWRRVALRTAGWCFVGVGLAVLLARRVGGNQLVDSLVASSSIRPAAHSAWTIGTSLLYDVALATFVYGVILVVAAWLAGPSRPAVAVRRALAPSLRHRVATVYAVVGIAFLLILLWGPTPATRSLIGIILLAVLVVVGVEALRRQTAAEFPDAAPGETMDRVRRQVAARRAARASSASPAAASASTAAGASGAVKLDELERLAALHERGALDDQEFSVEKAAILDGS